MLGFHFLLPGDTPGPGRETGKKTEEDEESFSGTVMSVICPQIEGRGHKEKAHSHHTTHTPTDEPLRTKNLLFITGVTA
ncbi:hypothetical protein EYF80_045386 [Liparis tanakae]|uniref:Uncharacterized protein n=1 Tax=Liparis tanakae TaxID=230148 RepID=A0A4Z2FUD3_9TELE|nr:hypothetical protein EYF80_045386 [Liparis tanakae]